MLLFTYRVKELPLALDELIRRLAAIEQRQVKQGLLRRCPRSQVFALVERNLDVEVRLLAQILHMGALVSLFSQMRLEILHIHVLEDIGQLTLLGSLLFPLSENGQVVLIA